VNLEHASRVTEDLGRDLVAIDDALSDFEAVDPARARVVELRFFAGFTNKETADVLGCSERTVRRHWRVARLWLYHELSGTRDHAP
jgi:RNA polymerase sigma factor (sigma-70 family)